MKKKGKCVIIFMIINKNKQMVLYLILYIVIGIIYTITIIQIVNKLNVFFDYAIYILIALYLLMSYPLFFNKPFFAGIIYIIWLMVILLSRTSKSGYSLDFYLWDWLTYLFTNKIVAINVIGNIIIYMPMGYFFRKYIYLGILVIIILELIQMLTNRGLFDIVDIILNSLGLLLGWLGVLIWMKIKTHKMMIKKMK